jgi:hypothetical protein
MDENRVEGTARKYGGRVQEGVGKRHRRYRNPSRRRNERGSWRRAAIIWSNRRCRTSDGNDARHMAAQRDRNSALYDCHRCIGNWLAAGQNASAAIGKRELRPPVEALFYAGNLGCSLASMRTATWPFAVDQLCLPQEKRIDGAIFSSRCRPPITAAPHAAAAPAASAAKTRGVEFSFWEYFKVGAPLTVLTIAFGLLWL